ncbi:5'-3' exonuclease [Paenibacillaceae bacterium]|nr:5'-3' exonuclease [Paenibacillaceae bacterium]
MQLELDFGIEPEKSGQRNEPAAEQHLQAENRLMLVDGMALLFRAYFATSFTGTIRRTSAGLPTNAVHGFVRYFWDAVQKFGPSHVVCCWDMGSKTFRTEQYTGYKANRPDAPLDLIPQFDLVKDVVESFGICNVGLNGYEADDCIGTLAKRHASDANVFVLTGDQDMLQLVDQRITVLIMKKGIGNYAVYTPEFLLEERNLTPAQIIDLKGLMGDTSDNYPGVRGIGEKTALKLVQEYGTIEDILERLPELSKAVRTKIEADLEMLHLSRDLARIRCDVPISHPFDEYSWTLNRAQVMSKFEELEFGSLGKLITGKAGIA